LEGVCYLGDLKLNRLFALLLRSPAGLSLDATASKPPTDPDTRAGNAILRGALTAAENKAQYRKTTVEDDS
jgi:hypothetical protein